MRDLLVVALLGSAIMGIGALIVWIMKVERSKDQEGTSGWCGYRSSDEYHETYGDDTPW